MYDAFCKIQEKYGVDELNKEGFILSTYLIVDTSEYKKGGVVFFHTSNMEQKIEVLDKYQVKIRDRTIHLGS